MSSLSRRDDDVARHERAISSLSDRAGVPPGNVRVLLAQELARLEPGARVHSYLQVLAASNVRKILGRRRKRHVRRVDRAPAAAKDSAATRATHTDGRMEETVRILIVDDDADSARALSRMLRESGHDETRIVHSAATALKAAVEYVPGVAFVDIELPDMSGYDVALRLHQHPRLQQLRLIALTDSREHPGRDHARASGFERYLVKPVDATALREVLDPSSR